MKGTIHLSPRDDTERERKLAEARERLVKAKAKWTRVTVDVLKRVPHAGAGVEIARAELDAAHADLDALNREAQDEEDA